MDSAKIRKYFTNLFVYFGASLIPMILNLVSNPWIAKNMSPEDYAVCGYYTSFTSLISPIILFYMIHFYIKEYFRVTEPERERLYATVAKALVWFSGAVSVVCFGLLGSYMLLSDTNESFAISPYLALMVFSLPLTGLLNLELAQFRMLKNARGFFVLSTVNGVLNVALAVLFVVLLHWGAEGKLLAPLVCNACVFAYMVIRLRHVWAVRTPWAEYARIFKFCLPLALSAMLGYFTNGFTTTYMESVGQVQEYGIYVVGVSLGTYLTVFSSAVGNTFQPDIYESVVKRRWKRYATFSLMQVGLIALIAIAFVCVAPFVVSLLTAGRYDAATPYAQIIALSTVTSAVYFLINNYSIATNRPKLYLYTTILGSIFMIVCVPLAVDRWTFYGGAWMSVASFMVFALINLLLLGFTCAGIIPAKYQ